MIYASNTNHELRSTEFTRVVDLLDDPFDLPAIARQFIDEVEDEIGGRNGGIFVLNVEPLGPADREEIEYLVTLAILPADARRLEGTPLELTDTI